jgi:hypothetical protein
MGTVTHSQQCEWRESSRGPCFRDGQDRIVTCSMWVVTVLPLAQLRASKWATHDLISTFNPTRKQRERPNSGTSELWSRIGDRQILYLYILKYSSKMPSVTYIPALRKTPSLRSSWASLGHIAKFYLKNNRKKNKKNDKNYQHSIVSQKSSEFYL